MKMYCASSLTGELYCPEDTIRIVNPKQVLFYLCKGLPIQDVFPSTNYQTGEKTIVFSVDKRLSHDLYIEWQNLRGIDPSLVGEENSGPKDQNEVRILNLKQVIFYLSKKAKLLRMVPMLDRYTHDPVLAFCFGKKETAEIYAEWKNQAHS